MKMSKLLTVAAMGLLGMAAAHADDSKRTVGEYTDDKVLHTKVWAALTEDKTAEASEINLEVYKGVVQLNGFVDNAKEKAQAESVAKAVSGVKGVENNLMIKQAAQTTGGAIDDSTISAKVKSALIDSLPEHYRIVVLLRHQQDLSYDEIAEALHLPLGTVKARIHRARALLKDRIQGTP